MDSQPSSSESFAALHPAIQRWIWDEGWTELRDAQEAAAAPILRGDTDVVISAATAAGKTEAAFLPICSNLASTPGKAGVQVLYLSPLKALVNDQTRRLTELCERIDVQVHPWHGDVAGSTKQRLLKQPNGVLLITPESLEAILCRRGTEITKLFAGLRYVVIDELHAFLGDERGRQLQSLLTRVELAIRKRVPRVGLSATLSDMSGATNFLRPGKGDDVVAVRSESDRPDISLRLSAFTTAPPDEDGEPQPDSEDLQSVATELFKELRGTDNLVFANARRDVEQLADILRRMSDEQRVTNEFFPHHGSLSKDIREDVEGRLKDEHRPATAVCTSTLELGIDIGAMKSIAQVGTPHSVSSLRQRLGRAGRRGEPAVLRMYAREVAVDERTPLMDSLHPNLVTSIAVVELMRERWYESPIAGVVDYSTLMQQIMAMIAQHGGVTAGDAHRVLCGPGPFSMVDAERFKDLLRSMATANLIMQTSDGLLLHDTVGERLVNHYEFYAVFQTPKEFRLFADGRMIGTVPIDFPLVIGEYLTFAGRRWRIDAIDDQQKVIELSRSKGGRPPKFKDYGSSTTDPRIHRKMLSIYGAGDFPVYLDKASHQMLKEGRDNFRRHGVGNEAVVDAGGDSYFFHWKGGRVGITLAMALVATGMSATPEDFAVRVPKTTGDDLRERVGNLLADPPPTVAELASAVSNTREMKYDWALTDALAQQSFASRSFDIDAAWQLGKSFDFFGAE